MTSTYTYTPYTAFFPSFLHPYLFYASPSPNPDPTSIPPAGATFTEIPVAHGGAAFFDPFDPSQPSSTFAAYAAQEQAQSPTHTGPEIPPYHQRYDFAAHKVPGGGAAAGHFARGGGGGGGGSEYSGHFEEPRYMSASHVHSFPGAGMAGAQDEHPRFQQQPRRQHCHQRQQRSSPPPYQFSSAFAQPAASGWPPHSYPQAQQEARGFPFAFSPLAAAGGLSGHHHHNRHGAEGQDERRPGAGDHIYGSSGGLHQGSFVRESSGEKAHYHPQHPYEVYEKRHKKDGIYRRSRRGPLSSGSGSGSAGKRKQKVVYRSVTGCCVM